MDKKEIEHKLEQARKDKEVANNVIDCQIETLQAQLAEAEKPKLRHGDYGTNKDGDIRLCCGKNENMHVYGISGSYETAYPTDEIEIRKGNIIADLQALKPKTAFEMRESLDSEYALRGSIEAGKVNLQIKAHGDCKTFRFTEQEYHAFILNLRCMEFQMKFHAAKKGVA